MSHISITEVLSLLSLTATIRLSASNTQINDPNTRSPHRNFLISNKQGYFINGNQQDQLKKKLNFLHQIKNLFKSQQNQIRTLDPTESLSLLLNSDSNPIHHLVH